MASAAPYDQAKDKITFDSYDEYVVSLGDGVTFNVKLCDQHGGMLVVDDVPVASFNSWEDVVHFLLIFHTFYEKVVGKIQPDLLEAEEIKEVSAWLDELRRETAKRTAKRNFKIKTLKEQGVPDMIAKALADEPEPPQAA